MKLPQTLIEEIANEICIPFIGSGISRNGKTKNDIPIPLWFDLIKQLCIKLGINHEQIPNDVNEYLNVAQQYEDEYSRLNLIKFLIQSMPLENYSPGYVHYLIQELNFNFLITTNYDDLIEKIYRTYNKKTEAIVSKAKLQLYEDDTSVTKVIKMHGDFNETDYLVFTKKDYDSFFSKNEFIADYLKHIFRSKSILLLGYSRLDPDFNQILDYRSRLGEFTKRLYIVDFNKQNTDSEYNIDVENNICNIILGYKDITHEGAIIKFLRELINAVNRQKHGLATDINKVELCTFPANFKYNNPATQDDIKNLEDRYSCRLPYSYKDFLTKANGGLIFLDDIIQVEVLGTKRTFINSFNEEKINFEHQRYLPVSYTPMAEDWWIYWCFDLHEFSTYHECPIVQVDIWDNVTVRNRFENFNDFLKNARNRFGVLEN